MVQYVQQMALSFGHDEHSLKGLLRQFTDTPLCLVITDNITSMLSVRKKGDSINVRLHRMFLYAGADICFEVAQLIKKGRCNRQVLSSFIRANNHLLRKKVPVAASPRVTGKHYCLLSVYKSLNSEYFDRTVSALITWGRGDFRQRVKLRTLGSYNADTNTIRINPVLDKKTVPLYFLEFVVYHEMLHAYLGMKTGNGRRSIHSKEFRLHEKKFRHYGKAVEWERMRFAERC